jgi:hypothetical protein
LIISGDEDNTAPPAIQKAAYNRQRRNEGITELIAMPERGHALTIDAKWRAVAETALAFVKRFA